VRSVHRLRLRVRNRPNIGRYKGFGGNATGRDSGLTQSGANGGPGTGIAVAGARAAIADSAASTNAGGAVVKGGASSARISGCACGANSGGPTNLGAQAATAGSTSRMCATLPIGSAYSRDLPGVTFIIDTPRLRLQVCKVDNVRVECTSPAVLEPHVQPRGRGGETGNAMGVTALGHRWSKRWEGSCSGFWQQRRYCARKVVGSSNIVHRRAVPRALLILDTSRAEPSGSVARIGTLSEFTPRPVIRFTSDTKSGMATARTLT